MVMERKFLNLCGFSCKTTTTSYIVITREHESLLHAKLGYAASHVHSERTLGKRLCGKWRKIKFLPWFPLVHIVFKKMTTSRQAKKKRVCCFYCRRTVFCWSSLKVGKSRIFSQIRTVGGRDSDFYNSRENEENDGVAHLIKVAFSCEAIFAHKKNNAKRSLTSLEGRENANKQRK